MPLSVWALRHCLSGLYAIVCLGFTPGHLGFMPSGLTPSGLYAIWANAIWAIRHLGFMPSGLYAIWALRHLFFLYFWRAPIFDSYRRGPIYFEPSYSSHLFAALPSLVSRPMLSSHSPLLRIRPTSYSTNPRSTDATAHFVYCDWLPVTVFVSHRYTT
jgi:hypothetical protein